MPAKLPHEIADAIDAEADALERATAARVANLRAAASQLRASAAPPVATFSGFTAKAADAIRLRPGQTGQKISDRINCSYSTFRKHIAPALLKAGFRNRKFGGGGYYPPT